MRRPLVLKAYVVYGLQVVEGEVLGMSLYLFAQFRVHLANAATVVLGLGSQNLVAVLHADLATEGVVQRSEQGLLGLSLIHI